MAGVSFSLESNGIGLDLLFVFKFSICVLLIALNLLNQFDIS